jgi:hypothetical protein
VDAATWRDAGTVFWHTEAIHKANLTADQVGALALGSFGVGNVRGLKAGEQAADPKRRRLHVVAVDADHQRSKGESRSTGDSRQAGYQWPRLPRQGRE